MHVHVTPPNHGRLTKLRLVTYKQKWHSNQGISASLLPTQQLTCFDGNKHKYKLYPQTCLYLKV